ncbi:MAG: hypothetical protein WD359_08505 [Dehalococcoidia bacterium]
MLRSIITTLFALAWAAVLVLTGGRFLALLFDANRGSEIIDRLYRHSDFWVKPFFGMLDLANKTVEDTGGIFEPASLIAFIVYFVAGLLIMGLLTANYGFIGGGSRRHAHDA